MKNKFLEKKWKKWVYWFIIGIVNNLWDKEIFGLILKSCGYGGDYDVYYLESKEFDECSGDFDKDYYVYTIYIPDLVNLNWDNSIRRYLGLDYEQVTTTSYLNNCSGWIKM